MPRIRRLKKISCMLIEWPSRFFEQLNPRPLSRIENHIPYRRNKRLALHDARLEESGIDKGGKISGGGIRDHRGDRCSHAFIPRYQDEVEPHVDGRSEGCCEERKPGQPLVYQVLSPCNSEIYEEARPYVDRENPLRTGIGVTVQGADDKGGQKKNGIESPYATVALRS